MASANATHLVCFAQAITNNGSVWLGQNPLAFSVPIFTVQVILVVLTTRIIVFLLLKPLHQPRVLAEIIGGILLGPSVMGQAAAYTDLIFPERSRMVLETIANLGLLCFLFLIGVEMDVTIVRQMGRQALAIAAAGMALPFVIGVVTSFTLRHFISINVYGGAFLVFLGVALSVTAFPVLARILADIKLLNTEIGRLSMSAAIINDVCAWVLLAMAIALTQTKGSILSSLWVLLFTIAFVLACFYFVRPAMWRLAARIPEGQTLSDLHVCLILTGMMVAALITDFIGVHSVFGAFVYGLAIPSGPLGDALIEKLEDFITGLLLPLYFVMSGLKMNLSKVKDVEATVLLVLVFVLACIGKIVGTVLIALFYSMPLREGLALGFLMNTRGVVEMIVLNIGRDKKVLDDESFAVMVVTSLIMTATVTPSVTYLRRPNHRLIGYKRRYLLRGNPEAELRVLACVHNTRNMPSIISLLNISNPTKRSPIFVYGLHLVELTGRASAIVIVHTGATGAKPSGKPVTNAQAQSNHIFQAFLNYDHQTSGISAQTLTIVSPYPTMHEDICNLAEEKHIALIILPFHKQQTVDGGMEPINPSIQTLNENMLLTAPCSVGILIDRGLSSKGRLCSQQRHSFHIALFFFGGPDDREALAYASRMVEQPGVTLTVVRFILGDTAASQTPVPPRTPYPAALRPRRERSSSSLSIATEALQEEQLDADYFAEFLMRNAGNDSVQYRESVVSNMEDTVAVFQSLESTHDLYVVGRRQCEAAMRLMGGLTVWAECPELGTVGDFFASTNFGSTVSVLVVQQYMGGPVGVDGPTVAYIETDRSSHYSMNNANQRTNQGAAQPFDAKLELRP